ncbi:hypothetical protein [Candidatus Trichorickettsia mobilis]|uniref:hypothetical protein n=1 Tax=Candidatus Trichorickettsia mobilis TaxID=1346319 RepID=UPI002930B6AF|nr:hypothetical protein [Candidatus Trichorickettsia mobilis]
MKTTEEEKAANRAEIIRQTKDDFAIPSPKKTLEEKEISPKKEETVAKEDTPKQWYQKVFDGVKKAASAVYTAVTSNAYSVGMGIAALVGTVATGGAALIAMGAAALTFKVTKTAIDAVKASTSRSLDKENDALIDYATALCVKQKTLELAPKLKAVEKDLYTPDNNDKLSTKEQHQFNTKLDIAEKLTNIINTGFDIAGLAMDPSKIARVGKNLEVGESAAYNVTTGAADLVGIGDDLKGLATTIKEKIANSPDLQAELREAINSERKRDNVGYDNLQELREQTRQLQIDNKAMVATLRDDNFHKFTKEEICNQFAIEQNQINSETPAVKKAESLLSKSLHAIKDAFDPTSKYNPNNDIDASKHSGLTSEVRKENEATIESTTQKDKPITRTQEAPEFSSKSANEQKSTTMDRMALKEQLTQDQQKINANMDKFIKSHSACADHHCNISPKAVVNNKAQSNDKEVKR